MEEKKTGTERSERNLASLYDHLFASLDRLKTCTHLELEANIKRAAAVRQTAQSIIDGAKVEIAARKMTKESSLGGFFPELSGARQLGAGDEKPPKKKD